MDALKKLALCDVACMRKTGMFPLLPEFLIAADINQEFIFTAISQHLKALT